MTDTAIVEVRRATQADHASLTRLYAGFFAEDGISVPEDRIAQNLAQMMADTRAAVFVARVSDKVIGLAAGSKTFGVEFGWAVEFEDLYVHPDHRGQGVSHRLVAAVTAWADAQDAAIVELVITAEAEADQGLTRFYARHGFVQSDRVIMHRFSR